MLNKLKSNGAWLGLGFVSCLVWSRTAAADVPLIEKDGWVFSFDGRVNAFASVAIGDDMPAPTPDPPGTTPPHIVMGANSTNPGQGIGDVGWLSNAQADKDNKLFIMRVRSGMIGNVLGFGLTKKFNETTSIRGYISIWSTIETFARDKWAPVVAEAREGYFTATGPWGSATVGRTLGWLGRTSWEIDFLYGHGYGLGLPCTDALGPSCGHTGTGVLFPGYSAGLSYSTPSLGGLKVHAGIYDPITFSTASSDWSRAPLVRPEGAVTFDTPLGDTGKLKIGVEGLWQPVSRIKTTTDPNTGATSKSDETTSIWGVSGGARVEVGPVRLGASAFHGRGIGLGYAGQRSVATEDVDSTQQTHELRTFTGYYGQAALHFGSVELAAGYGQGIVDQLDVDKTNPKVSVFHTQSGISGAVYYHVSDSVVLALDYFHYSASWYGAPIIDPMTMQPTGEKLVGEKQDLNFINAGVTYHW